MLGVLVALTIVSAALLSIQIFRMTESARTTDAGRQLQLVAERLARHYRDEQENTRATQASDEFFHNDDLLQRMTQVALADVPGVEGGFYSVRDRRLLGYAYPTYLGSGPKTDIPQAERPTILRIAMQAAATNSAVEENIERETDVILFRAEPLLAEGQVAGAVWLMHRLSGIRNSPWHSYGLSLIGLLIMAALVSAGAWHIARRLDRDVAAVESGVRALHLGTPPPIPLTGLAELDRLVNAINHLTTTVRLQQERREQLERRLQQADRLAILGRLVAGVAHEVRNPLSSIRLKIQLSRRGQVDVQKLLSAFDIIEQEISRLDRLVGRLLSVAKPSQSCERIADLASFVETRLQQWDLKAEALGVKVSRIPLDAKPASAFLDRDRLGQMLDNLVANAMEALSPTGGAIRVSFGSDEVGQFILRVEDSGPGLPGEAKQHLFEPFFTTKPQGTGLGLFLSAEIARALGGTLTHTESPLGGACFEIKLPVALADDPTESRACDAVVARG